MTQHDIMSSLAIFDYSRNKLCDLYDSQCEFPGQAYKIEREINVEDGIKTLSFSIPYMVDKHKNFRWRHLRSEYLVRLIYKGKTEWYIAQKPAKHKDKNGIYGEVSCRGVEASLKTKNIYMEFDDENGIGTLGELADKVLAGTGWTRGYTDPMLEQDGVTEKVRSLTSGNKQGSLGLICTLCELFKCYPVYDSDAKTVSFYNFNNRHQVLEGVVGQNLEVLNVNYDSSDICTRLYVEGEYAEDGYIGIDSVNPTGLTYILNFDYYREIGAFTEEHEAALADYLEDIADINTQISACTAQMIAVEDRLNTLIGQCKLALYYTTTGFLTPAYTYGDPTSEQEKLNVGDEVVVLKSNGTHRYETIVTTPEALIETGDYGIAKFVTKAAGLLGAAEVQVEAKEKQIENLEKRIAVTFKPETIAEYEAEIAKLRAEITTIFTKQDGLYAMMSEVMRSDGLLVRLDIYGMNYDNLRVEQDDVESDFIIAMGDMLRDGYWNNQNYVQGQEQSLYDDAMERMAILSRPSVDYKLNLIRIHKEFGIPLEDYLLNAIFKIHDDELEVHENLFVTKIKIGIDNEDTGDIEVSNKDITINSNNLGALLSRMSQLADLIDQKNTLYDRAKAITQNGSIYVDRLNGQIDVIKNQILSSVSNWHTDENGNIIFLSADGGSAMMLSGAGFMLANSKDDNGDWDWRTLGTGEGITADEIVAGFLSAERIEAGTISTDKVEPGFGGSLVLTGNPSIVSINQRIAPDFIPGKAYAKGQYVTYDGVLYVFTENFAGGTWQEATPYVSQTDVATEMELLPDKIVQEVVREGFSRTYIQATDPLLDPDKDVRTGDYWLKTTVVQTWGAVKLSTWQAVKSKTWGLLNGIAELYIYDGEKWYPVSDHAKVETAFTRIEQTADKILQTAQLFVNGKLESYSTIEQTALAISQYVTDNAYQIQSGIDINAQGIEIYGGKYIKVFSGGSINIDANGAFNVHSSNMVIDSETGEISLTGGVFNIHTNNFVIDSDTGEISMSGGAFNINTDNIVIDTETGELSIISGTFDVHSSNFTIDSTLGIVQSGDWVLTNKGIDFEHINETYGKMLFHLGESQLEIDAGYAVDPPDCAYAELAPQFEEITIIPSGGGPVVHQYAPNMVMKFYDPNHTIGGNAAGIQFTYTGKLIISGYGLFNRTTYDLQDVADIHAWSVYYHNLYNESSREVKHDIRVIDSKGDKLDALVPVSFVYNDDAEEHRHNGLIYEDTICILPEICTQDENNKAINYMELVPILLKEIQDLRARVKAIEGE